MGQILKLGMIGAGGIAKERHLPNLQKIDDIELFIVANRRYHNAQQAAKEWGFKHAVEDWQDVVNHPEVDAVFICTPPYLHREITLEALKQGKHVFCQARLAMDLEDAGRMFEVDQATPLTTMICPAPHYMSVGKVVQQWMSEERIGEIRHVVLTHASSSVLDPELPLHWRQRSDLQGINLLDVGIMGEILQKWFGPVRQLAAYGQTYVKQRPADQEGRTEVELPDCTSITGEFMNGILLTALFSVAVEGGKSSMEIYGSKGTLICNPFSSVITLKTSQGEQIIDVPIEEQGYWKAEAEFIQAIKEGTKGSPSFAEGIRYMAFTQSVMDSMKNKQMISIGQI